MTNTAIAHETLTIDGIDVRIDTVVAHGRSGFGFAHGGRTYVRGGYGSAAAAKRAARAAVGRAHRDHAHADDHRLDYLRVTIGDAARPAGY